MCVMLEYHYLHIYFFQCMLAIMCKSLAIHVLCSDLNRTFVRVDLSQHLISYQNPQTVLYVSSLCISQSIRPSVRLPLFMLSEFLYVSRLFFSAKYTRFRHSRFEHCISFIFLCFDLGQKQEGQNKSNTNNGSKKECYESDLLLYVRISKEKSSSPELTKNKLK